MKTHALIAPVLALVLALFVSPGVAQGDGPVRDDPSRDDPSRATPDRDALLAEAEATLATALKQADAGDPGARRAFAKAAAAYQRVADLAPPNAPGIDRATGAAWTYAGEPGQAMLAYKRALAADPNDARAIAGRDALRHAVNAPRSLRPRADGYFERLWVVAVDSARRVPPRAAGLLALACWSGCWLVLAWPAARARVPGWAVVSAFTLAVLAAVPTAAVLVPGVSPNDAVVIADAPSYRGPSAAVYEAAFDKPVPAGAEVHIAERRDGWVRAQLLDGRPCWLRADHVETVLPNAPTPAK